MRTFSQFVWAAVACLTAALPLATAVAQTNEKPVVLISIAPIEEQLADVNYGAGVVGRADDAKNLSFFAGVFTNGIDKKRPAGAYLVPSEGNVKVVAFIPVTDLKTVLATYEERIGKPKDAGDGVLEIESGPAPVFIKEQAGWAFISNDAANLKGLPADPTVLLGDLPKQYNVAIKVNVHDIPAELRQMAIDQIEQGMRQGLENNPGDAADRELAAKMAELSAKQITRVIQEVDGFTIGWSIDAAQKMTYVDALLTAVPGTGLARQTALLQDTTSGFAGFLLPGAAVTLNSVQRMAQEDIDSNVTLLELFRGRIEKEVDNDAGLSAQDRTAAKEVLQELFDAATDTVKAGKLDLGATLQLEPKSLSFAMGIITADGAKLEKTFAKLVELAKNEPEFPKVKLNAGKHGEVNLHTVTVPIPESEGDARELLGPNLDITVGTGSKSLYVAFGKAGQDLLKKSIDASSAAAAKQVPPQQINVYLKPIMKFAASMDDNPLLSGLSSSMENSTGSDEINIVSKPIPNGVHSRVQVSEGVLRLIGEAASAASKK